MMYLREAFIAWHLVADYLQRFKVVYEIANRDAHEPAISPVRL